MQRCTNFIITYLTSPNYDLEISQLNFLAELALSYRLKYAWIPLLRKYEEKKFISPQRDKLTTKVKISKSLKLLGGYAIENYDGSSSISLEKLENSRFILQLFFIFRFFFSLDD